MFFGGQVVLLHAHQALHQMRQQLLALRRRAQEEQQDLVAATLPTMGGGVHVGLEQAHVQAL